MNPLDWLTGLWEFLVGLLVPYTLDVRVASVFVMVTAVFFNLSSAALNKMFINVEQQREYMQVTKEYRALQREAKLSGDKKLQTKLRKREAAMRTLGAKTAKQQLKMTVISLFLFGFFFTLIGNSFQMGAPLNQPRPAAYLPMSFNPSEKYMQLPMFYWYLISSIAISRPLFRIIGIPLGLGLPGTEMNLPAKEKENTAGKQDGKSRVTGKDKPRPSPK